MAVLGATCKSGGGFVPLICDVTAKAINGLGHLTNGNIHPRTGSLPALLLVLEGRGPQRSALDPVAEGVERPDDPPRAFLNSRLRAFVSHGG